MKTVKDSRLGIDLLLNGCEIFPAMLDAISKAKSEVNLESFVFVDDEIGMKFVHLLKEKAEQGIRCRVIVDGFGARKMSSSTCQDLEDSGVDFFKFNPFSWRHIRRMNVRTHRKILVVDQAVAFIGGVGISKFWDGDARNPNEYRETHFRIRGAVVEAFQNHFMENWSLIENRQVFKKNESSRPQGKIVKVKNPLSSMELVCSSPYESPTYAFQNFKNLVQQAQKRICISTPYLIANSEIEDILVDKSKMGVDVRLLIPGPYIDEPIVRESSRGHWKKILKSEIKVYQYQPTFIHQKILLVDDAAASIGSVNFDPRSLALNWETNLNVYNPEFVKRLDQILEEDLSKSKILSYADWKNRPLIHKLRERLVSPFRGYF